MPARSPAPTISALRLVNGSTGDPALYLDFPGQDNAVLFDSGDLWDLEKQALADVGVVLLSHHHIDHLVGFDRLVRCTLDTDKTVHVFGPPGTIDIVEHKLRSQRYQFFPFMKVRYLVREIEGPGKPRPGALFACERKLAREELAPDPPTRSSLVLATRECRVRYALASHTVPCLAWALDVRRGWRFDRDKARGRSLQPGLWVQRVIAELEQPRSRRAGEVEVEGGRYRLEDLVRDCFTLEPAVRIAFVTDTRDDPETRPGLVKLAWRADRLYCDAYYREREARQAKTHGHLLAREAGALARDARVRSLVLMHLAPRYRGQWEALVREARAVFPDTHAELSTEPDDEQP